MEPTYWITVTHGATPDVIREFIRLSLDEAMKQAKRALLEGWTVKIGID